MNIYVNSLLFCNHIHIDYCDRKNISQSLDRKIVEYIEKNLFFKALCSINSTADLSISTEKMLLICCFQNIRLLSSGQVFKCLQYFQLVHIENLPTLCLLYIISKNYRTAVTLARLLITKSKNVNQQCKGYFLIGEIYETYFKQPIRAQYYFQQGANKQNCLYSLLCYIKSKKKKVKYLLKHQYKEKKTVTSRDYLFLRLRQLAKNDQHREFSETMYSMVKDDFLNPCLAFINLLSFLCTIKKKQYILQMVFYCYKRTSVILKDFFHIPFELIDLHVKNKIPIKDSFLCCAIMSQESKFYSHNLVSNKGALGSMQIMPQQAKNICKQLKIKYSAKLIREDLKYNILLCLIHFKKCAKFVNNHKVLSIFYYHSGTVSLKLFNILKQNNLLDNTLGLLVALEFITSNIARFYVHNTIESFIICNMCCNQRSLTIEDLYRIF